jgi:uroporphyrinogen-III decarboxylase
VFEFLKTNHPQVIRRQHMCGNTTALAAKMRELPVDIYEIDFPADLQHVRRDLGDNRVICGNVSTITDLLEGSPDTVYQACRRCHEICGRFHIVGGGCEVSPLTPPENLQAMIQYARDHQPAAAAPRPRR